MKGRKVFQPPRFMTAPQAAEQLLTVIQRRRDQGSPFTGVCMRACVCLCAHSVYICSIKVPLPPCAPVALSPTTPCVAMARLGAEDQVIVHCPLSAMLEVELGPPLHSLVVVGHTHPLEQEMLALFTKHT